MKKLLFSSSLLMILVACGTSEDSISTDGEPKDSSKVVVTEDDTSRAIIHGSPNQEEIDSLKRVKQEKNKKK